MHPGVGRVINGGFLVCFCLLSFTFNTLDFCTLFDMLFIFVFHFPRVMVLNVTFSYLLHQLFSRYRPVANMETGRGRGVAPGINQMSLWRDLSMIDIQSEN